MLFLSTEPGKQAKSLQLSILVSLFVALLSQHVIVVYDNCLTTSMIKSWFNWVKNKANKMPEKEQIKRRMAKLFYSIGINTLLQSFMVYF